MRRDDTGLAVVAKVGVGRTGLEGADDKGAAAGKDPDPPEDVGKLVIAGEAVGDGPFKVQLGGRS